MTKELYVQAFGKFFAGVLLLGILLFLPAGTLRHWNGWLLMGLLFLPMLGAGLVMMARSPELLKKRLNAREKEAEQRTVLALSALMFLAAFVSAGLSFRFGWLRLPAWASWVGAAVFLCAYLMYAEVLRENEFLSRTVEVQENQTVVDTGLYGVVRHPMYSATLFLFLSMGVVLGSVISFLILLFYIPIIVKRIKNEEAVLSEGLAGYTEYQTKVKYRLFPFVW